MNDDLSEQERAAAKAHPTASVLLDIHDQVGRGIAECEKQLRILNSITTEEQFRAYQRGEVTERAMKQIQRTTNEDSTEQRA